MAKSVLFANLEPEIEKELRGDFKSSLLIRKRIQTILRNKIETTRRTLMDKDNYKNGDWGYLMADGIGYERALHEIISLLEDSEK